MRVPVGQWSGSGSPSAGVVSLWDVDRRSKLSARQGNQAAVDKRMAHHWCVGLVAVVCLSGFAEVRSGQGGG